MFSDTRRLPHFLNSLNFAHSLIRIYHHRCFLYKVANHNTIAPAFGCLTNIGDDKHFGRLAAPKEALLGRSPNWQNWSRLWQPLTASFPLYDQISPVYDQISPFFPAFILAIGFNMLWLGLTWTGVRGAGFATIIK